MKRILLSVLLLIFFASVLAGIVLWRESGRAPVWYQPLDPADARVHEIAERTEYGLVEEFHRLRPEPEPWKFRVGETHLNAWFAARLPEWLAHAAQDEGANWPSELGMPQVHISERGIEIAIEAQKGGSSRVLVTRLVPEFVEGRIRLVVDSVGVGRVDLPGPAASALLDLIDEIAPGGVIDENATQQFLSMLSGGSPVDSSIELSDGRRIELLGLALTNGGIEFTNRTLPAAP